MELRGIFREVVAPVGTDELVVVAAVPGRRILIIGLHVIASAATNVIFKSASTPLSGVFGCPQEGTINLSQPLIGLFVTAEGEPFVIDQSVDGVDGFLSYLLI